MRDKTANTLAALLVLAATATAAEIPSMPPIPEASVEETPPEEIAPMPPLPVGGENVTFDTMDSIPFENAVEPPDDPPALDNGVRTPGLDNNVPPPPPAAIPPAPPVLLNAQ